MYTPVLLVPSRTHVRVWRLASAARVSISTQEGVGVGVIETVECLFVCAETVSQTVLRGRFVVVVLNYVDPLAGFFDFSRSERGPVPVCIERKFEI